MQIDRTKITTNASNENSHQAKQMHTTNTLMCVEVTTTTQTTQQTCKLTETNDNKLIKHKFILIPNIQHYIKKQKPTKYNNINVQQQNTNNNNINIDNYVNTRRKKLKTETATNALTKLMTPTIT